MLLVPSLIFVIFQLLRVLHVASRVQICVVRNANKEKEECVRLETGLEETWEQGCEMQGKMRKIAN